MAEVLAARTGMQDYLGSEADPENEHGMRDRAAVAVYRPASEVFKADSLATFAAAPVTLDHPSVAVTADNWRQLGRGEINGDVVRDGERVRVPIIIRDAATVAAATTTHKQLSMGYATKLVFPADGKHPDGTACDAYQTDIRINHIALVRAARGGPELRVVDERPPQIQEKPVKNMTIDGLTVDVSNADTAVATIQTLMAARDDFKAKLVTADAKAVTDAATIVTKDAEIARLTKELADSKPTPAQMREAGKAYALVADKAKAAGVTVTDAMDEGAIMKAVVDKAMPGNAYDGDHVRIAFETLTKDHKPSADTVHPLGDAVVVADDKPGTDARAKMIADMLTPAA